MFDRGIKNKLLKELGDDMSTEESALAVLIEEADWETLRDRMAANDFKGEVVVSEIVEDQLDEVEKLTDDPEKVEAVPEEMELPEAAE